MTGGAMRALVAWCLFVYGYAAFNGRPLTMHEARLPQTAREMQATGELLLPHSGSRPWLERPPLPHWIVIAFAAVLGHHDRVVVARLPSAMCGLAIVLLTVWTASRLFGRTVGLVSGFTLATQLEFWTYCTLAEDDIYLALLVSVAMALFVRVEWPAVPGAMPSATGPFGSRPWPVLGLFVAVGASNWAKAPLLGPVVIAASLGSFLLGTGEMVRVRRYAWFWGVALAGVLTLGWPLAAYARYPDVVEAWRFDYLGRVTGEYASLAKPLWYYPAELSWRLLPWTPAALWGLWITRDRVRRSHGPERWVWAWAIAPIVLLSLPRGKHHHYLVPCLAPWAILAALGYTSILGWLRRRWTHVRWRLVHAGALAALGVLYCAISTCVAARTRAENTLHDTAFLRDVQVRVPPDRALWINADVGTLDFFRLQFYSRDDAVLLHNLSYLRDASRAVAEAYVVTRARDAPILARGGTVRIVTQSADSHGGGGPDGRFTLFHVCFRSDLRRVQAPRAISCMQALGRAPGPECEDPDAGR